MLNEAELVVVELVCGRKDACAVATGGEKPAGAAVGVRVDAELIEFTLALNANRNSAIFKTAAMHTVW